MTELSTAPVIPGCFKQCRELVTPALRAAVARVDDRVGRLAAFSFGWTNPDGSPAQASGGKSLRPALALLAARAVGGSAESAVPGAVAVELVHAFSLVHDDIMDQDEFRRNRPTVWKAFGVGPAVLAGDGLFALAVDEIARVDTPASPTALRMLSTALVDLVDGQAADLAFEGRRWYGPTAVTVDEYLAMAARKTGALLGCALAFGALFGGARPDAVPALAAAGRELGVAFQAVDDLLGIWGDPEVTGKPVFSDLRRRKKTLPVIAALDGEPVAARKLARLLSSTSDPSLFADEAADLIDAAGGRVFATARARSGLDRALRTIADTAIDPVASADLVEVVTFLGQRIC